MRQVVCLPLSFCCIHTIRPIFRLGFATGGPKIITSEGRDVVLLDKLTETKRYGSVHFGIVVVELIVNARNSKKGYFPNILSLKYHYYFFSFCVTDV